MQQGIQTGFSIRIAACPAGGTGKPRTFRAGSLEGNRFAIGNHSDRVESRPESLRTADADLSLAHGSEPPRRIRHARSHFVPRMKDLDRMEIRELIFPRRVVEDLRERFSPERQPRPFEVRKYTALAMQSRDERKGRCGIVALRIDDHLTREIKDYIEAGMLFLRCGDIQRSLVAAPENDGQIRDGEAYEGRTNIGPIIGTR